MQIVHLHWWAPKGRQFMHHDRRRAVLAELADDSALIACKVRNACPPTKHHMHHIMGWRQQLCIITCMLATNRSAPFAILTCFPPTAGQCDRL
jgi:hypothetical protein